MLQVPVIGGLDPGPAPVEMFAALLFIFQADEALLGHILRLGDVLIREAARSFERHSTRAPATIPTDTFPLLVEKVEHAVVFALLVAGTTLVRRVPLGI
jgi:hypothetical protein